MTTVGERRAFTARLREAVQQLPSAFKAGDLEDALEILSEIDGASAAIREWVEEQEPWADNGAERDQVSIPWGTPSDWIPPTIDDNTGYTDRDFI